MQKTLPKLLLFTALFTACGSRLFAQADVKADELIQMLQRSTASLGISRQDAAVATLSSYHTDAATRITYAYLQQVHDGLPVFNAILSVAVRDGHVARSAGAFVTDIAGKAGSATPAIDAVDAARAALAHLGLDSQTPLSMAADSFATHRKYYIAAPGLTRRDVAVSLMWLPRQSGQSVSLVWNVNIDLATSEDWWNIRIDATTGQFLEKDNWTVHEHSQDRKAPAQDFAIRKQAAGRPAPAAPVLNAPPPPPNVTSASYRVVPFPLESPNFGSQAIVSSPWLLAGAGNNAATHGWHFDGTSNYTITRGNNVFAHLDVSNNNTPNATNNWPDTSAAAAPALSFTNAPNYVLAPGNNAGINANKKFAITNLFYWNNIIHDLTYQYGFTEAAGNFQRDNMSRGGTGSDWVSAQAQDGGGTNNANFSTPDDGTSGRMQMYLWSAVNAGFTVTAPASVAGFYVSKESTFSTANKLVSTGSKSGQVVYYNDNAAATHLACVAPSNAAALSGKIALIDRGGACAFSAKVLAAQNAGAIAAIVINNAAGEPVAMGGTANNSVVIPAVMISQALGAALVAQLANGLSVTISAPVALDGDLDNGIVVHEYGHGISNRLTGGRLNSSCLSNAEQGGEGWSDYLGLMMTTNWATATVNDGTIARGIGTYALGETATGPGIRSYPYSTNMAVNPLTYASVAANSTLVHAIGTVWCTALWDMTWSIIQQTNSITPNLYNAAGSGGNVIALNLVMTGMKLQPCCPGFLDARDAILAADSLLYGGAHRCAIWNAFAARGMGYSASQGSPYSATDQTVAFDKPAHLRLKTASVPVATPSGADVSFTHTVYCDCEAASGWVLRDTIPTGFTYISSTPAGTLSGNVLSFPATSLAALDSQTYTLVLQPGGSGATPDTSMLDNRDGAATGGLTGSGSPAWSSSAARAYSGSNAWFVSNSGATNTAYLTSANIAAPSGSGFSLLSFWHWFSTEPTYDGARVEYSTNNGANWSNAAPFIIAGGYNTSMNSGSPYGAQTAWSGAFNGAGTFRNVLLDLSSLGSSPLRIRFRMSSDITVGAEGWYVDDILKINGTGGLLKTGLYNSTNALRASASAPLFITPASVLPLSLLSFAARAEGTAAGLAWETADERDVAAYHIVHSTDAQHWTELGVLTAKNGARNQYAFTHPEPATGRNYYRLRIADQNGGERFSNTEALTFGSGLAGAVTASPNPAADFIALSNADAGLNGRQATVTDINGRTVLSFEMRPFRQLDVRGWPAGVYVLRLPGKAGMIKLAVR